MRIPVPRFLATLVALHSTAALTHAQTVSGAGSMTAKQQVEQLMNEGVPFAKKMLSDYGEFYPFGLVLLADGTIQHVGAKGQSEHPPSQELIDLLIDSFRKGAKEGRYKAVAVVLDVKVKSPTGGGNIDAVQVGLEHRDSYCADVYFPYTINKGTVTFGEIWATRRTGSVYETCNQ